MTDASLKDLFETTDEKIVNGFIKRIHFVTYNSFVGLLGCI